MNGDLLHAVLECLPQRVFVKDVASVYRAASVSFAHDLGLAPEAIVGRTDLDLFPPELAEKYRADDRRVLATGDAIRIEEPYVRDGAPGWIETTKAPVRDVDGRIVGVVGIFTDISERRRDAEALAAERTLLEALLRNVPTLLFLLDETGRLVRWSHNVEAVSGRTGRELGGALVFVDVHADDRERLLATLQQALQSEQPVETEGRILDWRGEVREYLLTGRRVDAGGRRYVLGIGTDITERKRAEAQVRALQSELREQAIHDPLTGLYNRRHLEETFERELIRARRRGYAVSVVIADIDHFKRLNDTRGHPAGDEVLRALGALLRREVRGSDIVCRYGGEEFLVVLPETNARDAYARAEQWRQRCEALRVDAGDAVLAVTLSFGVAEYPAHAQTTAELVAAADRALYEAKRAGRNCSRIAGAAA